MRGKIIPNGEFLAGYYYDVIEKRDDNGNILTTNGKAQYEYSTIPIGFHFKDGTQVGSSLFQYIKGLERKTYNFGGVYQTHEQTWRIFTSNADIPFKPNGKVKVYSNGVPYEFTIKKIVVNQGNVGSLPAGRYGRNSTNYFPLTLEIC